MRKSYRRRSRSGTCKLVLQNELPCQEYEGELAKLKAANQKAPCYRNVKSPEHASSLASGDAST